VASVAFKDDNARDLGVMYQHYFDCYSISDQVHYITTLEKLQQYVGENYKFGREISAGIADPTNRPTVPVLKMPQKKDQNGKMVDVTPDELGYADKIILETRMELSIQHEFQLKAEVAVLYSFIFRRCTTLLQDRLQAHERFDDIRASADPFELLQIIRETVYKTEDTAYVPLAIISLMEAILATKQGNLSIPKFHAQFKNMLETMSSQGGSIDLHPGVSNMVAKELFPNVAAGSLTLDQKATVKTRSKGQFAAALFLK
jgi:hypothetical protein